MEQAEYAREGVEVPQIDFQDNQPTLDMFLAVGSSSHCDHSCVA